MSGASSISETELTAAGSDRVDEPVRETAYVWDLQADTLDWCDQAAAALRLEPANVPATGDAFAALIGDEHARRYADAIAANPATDAGTGVTYTLRYRLAPHGPRTRTMLWVEDTGRWWAGPNGKPTRARGRLKISAERPGPGSHFSIDVDELTGLLNRIRLTDALATVITRTRRQQTSAGLLMVAVNNLQHINETFGFEAGDAILAEVARRAQAVLRGGDSIGRHSSNKFAAIINDCSHPALEVAADRILKAATETPIDVGDCPLHASVSIGGLVVPQQASDVSAALTGSLRALDQARAVHGSRVTFYEADLESDSRRANTVSVAGRLSRALNENRLCLALQTIVDSGARAPALYECLLRLDEPGMPPLSASVFVPVAEELGLASMIDRRALDMAIDLLKRDSDISLSLNVSALTCSDAGWIAALETHIAGRPDLAKRLVVEITETIALSDLSETGRFVDGVRRIGCRVAIDDFGAGYTSFANLKRLNFDLLKIDGSFVRNIVHDPSDQMFMRMMVELAENFGLETVAEWVVDQPTADMVAEMGVTYLQGFHYSEPRPAEIVLAERAARKTALRAG
ncbi:MAG: bifunctional diguanylate cyclase/phosphodiesterase [Pseudomonadota bacterium]